MLFFLYGFNNGEQPLTHTKKEVITSTLVHTFHVHNALYKIRKISLDEFPGFMTYHKFVSKLHYIIAKSLNGIIRINDTNEEFDQYIQLARDHALIIKENKTPPLAALESVCAIGFLGACMGYAFSFLSDQDEIGYSHLALAGIGSLYATLIAASYYGVQYELQEECETLFIRHINRLEYAYNHRK
jgi:hypothetical protein